MADRDREKTLGGRVELTIERSGLAHNEFAREADVFTSVLSRWKADRQPKLGRRSAAVLLKIAKAGRVDADWLAGQPVGEVVPFAPSSVADEDDRYPSKRPAARALRGLVDEEAISAMLSEEHKGSNEDPGAEFWMKRARWWQGQRDEIRQEKQAPPPPAAASDEDPPLEPRPRIKPKTKPESSGVVPIDRTLVKRTRRGV